MKDFYAEKTFNTPEISFSPSTGTLKIEGRSIPEDPGEIYDELIKMLNAYFIDPKEKTQVDIKLEYINSGSSKYMLEVLRTLKKNFDKGRNCEVNWHYEEDDESIYELGLHYQRTLQIPFNLIDYY